MKIMIVDDSKAMRRIVMRTLRQAGFGDHETLEAENGAVALDKVNEGSPDVILCDWNMPERSGFDVLVWARSNENYSLVPFLMATAHSDKKQTQKAFEAGATGLIAKPFEVDELRVKIHEALGLKSRSREIPEEERTPRRMVSGKVRLRVAHIQTTDHLILGVLRRR